MRKHAAKLASLATAAALLGACSDGERSADDARLTVVATTTQVGDLARNVAGPGVRVAQILRANTDPHAYEPRPSDARAVTAARLVLRSGGDLDEWLSGLLDNAGSDARAVTLLDRVRVRREGRSTDPHWWQDPRNGVLAANAIRDALTAADPGEQGGYARRAAAYTRRLRSLDRAIERCVAPLPRGARRVVTDHDALGYFARRYAIAVVGTVIPALSTRAQSSAGDISALVKTIRRERVRTIFPESSVGTKLERAVAREAGARVGPALYADTLGPEGSPGETYIGSLRFNARAVVAGMHRRAARCELPR